MTNPNSFPPGWNQSAPPAAPSPNFLQRMSTKTKVLVAAGVLGGVGLIGILSGTMHGHGPQPFLNAVEDAGFYNRSGDSAALSHGYDVCEALDAGSSRASVISQTYAANNLSRSSAEKFVDIAEDYLC